MTDVARICIAVLAVIVALALLCATVLAEPTMDLAPEYRYRNPDGSCVHCSTVHLLHWQGLHDAAWRWKASYRRGEYSSRHKSKMDHEQLLYAMTDDGDERLLEYAIESRRFAGVTWGGAHCVNLVGREMHNGQLCAVILDNNLISRFKYQPWDQFLAEWRSCGGWAFVILSGDVPPPTPE